MEDKKFKTPEKIRAKNRLWQANNPDKMAASVLTRLDKEIQPPTPLYLRFP